MESSKNAVSTDFTQLLGVVRFGMLRRIIICLSVTLNIGGLIGLFTLPEDIPVALQRLGAVAMWFDRETVLIGLFGISSLGFGWVLFQPIILKFIERRRNPELKISFPADINSDAKYGINKSSMQYIATDAPKDHESFGRVVVTNYFFDIENTTSKTITNVSVKIHLIDTPLPFHLERNLVSRNGQSLFNIRPGDTEFIQLGFSHRYARDGIAEHVSISDMSNFNKLKGQWKYDPGFMVILEGNSRYPLLKNDSLRIIIGVYGDNVRPTHHRFKLNCKDKVEIFYEGRINLDEPLEPRRPKSTEQKTQL